MELAREALQEGKHDNDDSNLAYVEAEIRAALDSVSPDITIVERLDYETCNYFVLHSDALEYHQALEKAVRDCLTPCYSLVEIDGREARENWPTPVPVETLAVKREALPVLSQEEGGPPTLSKGFLSLLGILIIAYVVSILYRLYV
jgi:hypothetical protein